MDNLEVTPNDWVPEPDSIIKVLGVGGGGCNAVNYMYNQKIEGCTFIVCNTDSQALNKCDVPVKIQLGEGIGMSSQPQLRTFHMGINLGGVQILMAQDFLHGFHIHAAGKHHGGGGMPELMGRKLGSIQPSFQ